MRFYKKRKENATTYELVNLETLFLVEGEMRSHFEGEYLKNSRYYIAKGDRNHYYDAFSGLRFKIHGQRNDENGADETKDGIYVKQMAYLKDYVQDVLEIGDFERKLDCDNLYLTKAELFYLNEKINAMKANGLDFFDLFSEPEE